MGAPGILLALLVLFGIGEPRQALPSRAMRPPPESVAVSLTGLAYAAGFGEATSDRPGVCWVTCRVTVFVAPE